MSAFNPTKWEQRWCPACEREVAASRRRPGHALHLLLSCITLGLWAVVWLFLGLGRASQPLRCAVCHTPTTELAEASRVKRTSDVQEYVVASVNEYRDLYDRATARLADRSQPAQEDAPEPHPNSTPPPGWAA